MGKRDKAWARRYVWAAMATTLRSDLHENGAAYIYEEEGHSDADRLRVIEAAEHVLKTMQKRGGVSHG